MSDFRHIDVDNSTIFFPLKHRWNFMSNPPKKNTHRIFDTLLSKNQRQMELQIRQTIEDLSFIRVEYAVSHSTMESNEPP